MGRKATPGLTKRSGIWHIDKQIGGRRICQSTGTHQLDEAERFLARILEENRQAEIYGRRPTRTFDDAAAKFVLENQHKRSLNKDITLIKQLLPWIGHVTLDRIHFGTLEPWIEHRRKEGKSVGTINHGLKIVRRILNLAATEWIDEYGLSWLAHAPKIRLIPDTNKRKPYPLSWEEQEALFRELPGHLAVMAFFAVNTGCRDSEICRLRWEWEVKVPTLDTFVFIVPGQYVKNTDDRLVVLNRIARSVVEGQRGKHPTNVFSYRGKPIQRMLNSAWLRARKAAKLE